MAEGRQVTRSEDIAADIRRLKCRRDGHQKAIDALENLLVEALLLESGYSTKETKKIMRIYEELDTRTEK